MNDANQKDSHKDLKDTIVAKMDGGNTLSTSEEQKPCQKNITKESMPTAANLPNKPSAIINVFDGLFNLMR